MLSPFSHAISNITSPFLNRRRGGDASPLALFAGGAIGVWLDPSAVANLDWRRNLLTFTEQFDNAAWEKGSGSITATNIVDPIGGNTAAAFTSSGSSAILSNFTNITVESGRTYTASVWLKLPSGTDTIFLAFTNQSFNILQSVNCSVTSSWQRFTVSGSTGANTAAKLLIGGSSTIGLGEVVHIWGAQLELGSVATDYQKITDIDREVISRFSTTTMFKDAAGTSPITTPGDPVGLRLDKSKGLVLGPELVTNGDFTNPITTGWSAFLGASLSVDNSRLKITSTGANPYAVYAISTIANKWYSFTVNYDAAAHPGQLAIYPASNTSGSQLNTMSNVTGSGVRSCYFMATGTTSYVHVQGITVTSGVSFFFDNISVREVPGNHASQSTIAGRPTYGIEPRGGRRNLLLWSENYGNAAWVKTELNVSGEKLIPTAVPSVHSITQDVLDITDRVLTVEAKADGYNLLSLGFISSTGPQLTVNLSTGAVARASGTGIVGSSITLLSDGYYRISLAVSQASRYDYALAIADPSGDGNPTVVWTGNGTSGILVRKPQYEAGSIATNYQKVTTEYDITEAGVPTRHYVAYSGSHSMSTATIDFTATDKMSVFAGIRKLSDVGQMIVGLGPNVNTSNGSFEILTRYANASAEYAFVSIGTTLRSAEVDDTAFLAPISNILTGISDISGDRATLRVNGTQVAQSTADQGTGNFGNYPIYFGRRGGATIPFYGRDYGIIVVGKTVSAAEITATETWLFDKTGIFAPIITGVPTIGAS